jgi:hypothetical protein
VKIKVGRAGIEDDERRIRTALGRVGKYGRVMVDANQVFNRNEALRRGRIYQQMGCFSYEEPLSPQEMEGYAMLAQELDIRIATGENLNTKYAFADLIAAGAPTWCNPTIVEPAASRSGWNCRRCGCVQLGTGKPRRWQYQSEHAAGEAERNLHGDQRRSQNDRWRVSRARGARNEQRDSRGGNQALQGGMNPIW